MARRGSLGKPKTAKGLLLLLLLMARLPVTADVTRRQRGRTFCARALSRSMTALHRRRGRMPYRAAATAIEGPLLVDRRRGLQCSAAGVFFHHAGCGSSSFCSGWGEGTPSHANDVKVSSAAAYGRGTGRRAVAKRQSRGGWVRQQPTSCCCGCDGGGVTLVSEALRLRMSVYRIGAIEPTDWKGKRKATASSRADRGGRCVVVMVVTATAAARPVRRRRGRMLAATLQPLQPRSGRSGVTRSPTTTTRITKLTH